MVAISGVRSCGSWSLAGVVLASLASACLGAPITGDDGSSSESSSGADTSPPSDTTIAATSGTDGTSGTSGTTDDDTADSGTSDTGPLACEPLAGLPDISPILEVTVEILNDTAEPVYMLESADACTPYGLTRGDRPLPFAFGYGCPCECGPAQPYTYVTALAPGQSLVLTWDGRVMVYYNQRFYCEWKGPSGVEEWCETGSDAALQPLDPGPLTLTIPIYDEEGDYYPRWDYSPQELDACASPRSFSVDFELGTEDLTIPIALSEVVIQ